MINLAGLLQNTVSVSLSLQSPLSSFKLSARQDVSDSKK